MIKKNFLKTAFRVLVISIFLSASVLNAAAGVDIYAEGAYTDSDLAVYIYADITDEAICSAGVKLTYDPSILTYISSEKNEAVWFMGDGTEAGNNDYMDPEHSGNTIIVICGKLDTADPTAGVIGNRVLLGKIYFTIEESITTPVSEPEDGFFGISLDLGRVVPYVNFATTTGDDLDSAVTISSITIKERGDADGDRRITTSDYFTVKGLLSSNIYHCYADCDADERITTSDYFCIKGKL